MLEKMKIEYQFPINPVLVQSREKMKDAVMCDSIIH
jgi:hypothetical protein